MRKHQSKKCMLSELKIANARITTLQTQLDQRWKMMRALEVECGTKDVAEAVKYIKGLKARVQKLESVVLELTAAGNRVESDKNALRTIFKDMGIGGCNIGNESTKAWIDAKEWDREEKKGKQ